MEQTAFHIFFKIVFFVFFLLCLNSSRIFVSLNRNIKVSNSILCKTRFTVSFASLNEEMELSGNISNENTLLSYLSTLHRVL